MEQSTITYAVDTAKSGYPLAFASWKHAATYCERVPTASIIPSEQVSREWREASETFFANPDNYGLIH